MSDAADTGVRDEPAARSDGPEPGATPGDRSISGSDRAVPTPRARPMPGDLIPGDLGRRLDPVHGPLETYEPLAPAAVVALLTPDERLVLIERSSRLRSHAGQIAFPGGKPEVHDRDLLDTALREAEEEVALDRDAVRVLGRLSPVPTPTGFYIVPFVARVEGTWRPRVASGEVARVLVPELRELTDPTIHRVTATRRWRGRSWDLHEFAISDPPLWGATARMTWELLERMGHV